MGLMDLSTSAASKKHVDFSDARYQAADRLRQNMNKNIRATFTLYDSKESQKVAVQDISAAYILSDKRLPIGEIINKMIDLIVDMEDRVLDTEKDAIYAWKYSMALLEMYDDKSKRQGTLCSFDNSLKNSVIGSTTFMERFPGKYTNRTNFFDAKVKKSLMDDIVSTFRDIAVPQIHRIAIEQSKKIAEEHQNKILDRIVLWAVENYKCEVESFFEVKEEPGTQLFFSTNTIILHLRNGYDMSIIGYVGTEYDDKFAISISDARDIFISKHNEQSSQDEIKDSIAAASNYEPIDPLARLLKVEYEIRDTLEQQYEILKEIRPMVPADVLSLKVAESVVGKDYVWGCDQYRKTHEDLPLDFKFEDIELPELRSRDEIREGMIAVPEMANIANALIDSNDGIDSSSIDAIVNDFISTDSENVNVNSNTTVDNLEINNDDIDHGEDNIEVVEVVEPEIKIESQIEVSLEQESEVINNEQTVQNNIPDNIFADSGSAKQHHDFNIPEDLFAADVKEEEHKKKFGEPGRIASESPTLASFGGIQNLGFDDSNGFDSSATLLPGFTEIKKMEEAEIEQSFTNNARPIPKKKSDDGIMVWQNHEPIPIVRGAETTSIDTPSIPSLNIETQKIEKVEVKNVNANDLDDLDDLFA